MRLVLSTEEEDLIMAIAAPQQLNANNVGLKHLVTSLKNSIFTKLEITDQ